jgi:catechol-2,3-dioxygenase
VQQQTPEHTAKIATLHQDYATEHTRRLSMAKIGHIAIRCEDVEATAARFQRVFGLQWV